MHMKRTILVLSIVLAFMNATGQFPWQFSIIEPTLTIDDNGNVLIKEKYTQIDLYLDHIYKTGDWSKLDNIAYINLREGNYVYILAYEPIYQNGVFNYKVNSFGVPNVKGGRKLYLYRKDVSNIDNPWVIASDLIFTAEMRDGVGESTFAYANKAAMGVSQSFYKGNYIFTIHISEFRKGYTYSVGILFVILNRRDDGFYEVKQKDIYTRKLYED